MADNKEAICKFRGTHQWPKDKPIAAPWVHSCTICGACYKDWWNQRWLERDLNNG